MDRLHQIDTFSRFTQVSRETISSLKKYEDILIKHNKKLNLIGKSTEKDIWLRHFLDSSQVIDLISKNDKEMLDFGTGAGFPGLLIAIICKDKKVPLKIKLIEKSPKKIRFLKEVIDELDLNVDLLCMNILTEPIKIYEDLLIARAFKPLKIIFELIHNKAQNWKKFIIFLGKTGKNELLQASKIWDIEYKQRTSITSNDSLVIEINKLKKKN